MEIKIDTSKDHVDHIKKAIMFLQDFVEHNDSPTSPYSTPSYENSTPEISEGMFGMFDNDQAVETTSEEPEESEEDVRIMAYDDF